MARIAASSYAGPLVVLLAAIVGAALFSWAVLGMPHTDLRDLIVFLTASGLGSRTIDEAQAICNEWTGTFTATCGDWAQLGPTRLTNAAFGSRAGGNMAAVERTTADTSRLSNSPLSMPRCTMRAISCSHACTTSRL